MSHVLALSGGVGGAKLALGFTRVLPPRELTVVCNTADDFEHLGLSISPDLDSVMYALAGKNDQERGWGRADEGWRFMDSLSELGGETWFNLGDRDLATHVERTRRLRDGASLTEVTEHLCRALGIEHRVAPMSDDPVRTVVETGAGDLAFQHYFVRDRCEPAVTGFRFEGVEKARPSGAFLEALESPHLSAIVICPSNPFLSVDPILQLPGIEERLRNTRATRIAVSPIVGGQALKGPAAKIMTELNMPATATEVARHYKRRDLIDAFVLDQVDEALKDEVQALGAQTLVTNTVMETLEDRERLACECLALARG